MKELSIFLLTITLAVQCLAADQSPSASKSTQNPNTALQKTATPLQNNSATANKPNITQSTQPKPVSTQVPLKTSAEISAFTSELSDQFYTRINLTKENAFTKWYIRTGYSINKSYSYSGTKKYTTKIDTYSLDSQYRNDLKNNYRFISANAIVRDRTPYSPIYGGKSGYYMVSSGVGKPIAKGLEAEIALAGIATYDHGEDRKLAPVSNLRWKTNLTKSLSLDGRTYIIRPFDDDVLIDARTDLTYKFNPSLSLKLTYIANNLITPVNLNKEWDRSIRLSLVFSHTSKK